MFSQRKAGILLHPTSLPGRHGIGDLGTCSYRFIDFLYNAKQKFWQILPLSPVSDNGCPYSGFSIFAGNILLIDLNELVKFSLIDENDLIIENRFNTSKVHYTSVIDFKSRILKKAANKLKSMDNENINKYFKYFISENSYWLDDYALFMSIMEYIKDIRSIERRERYNPKFEQYYQTVKDVLSYKEADEYYYGSVWSTWDFGLVQRDEKVLTEYRLKLEKQIYYHKFSQFIFHYQWDKLKDYANSRDVRIIGDLPIYVAYNSVDVWKNKELFILDENGYPKFVSGTPPDFFSKTGQRWGNPIYNWKKLEKTDYGWWINRINKAFKMHDIMRIDHFRGFDTFWCVNRKEETSINGKWEKGPGIKFFECIKQNLGNLPIIAEDLGIIDDNIRGLREAYGYPGLAVLQFGFDGKENNPHLPDICSKNTVAYTGTHDNDTTVGWYKSLDLNTQKIVSKYIGLKNIEIAHTCVKKVYEGNANTVIIPFQDIYEQDSYHRMNIPGVVQGNWGYRCTDDMLDMINAKKLAKVVERYNRG